MKKKSFLLVLTLVSLTSCNFNSFYTDRKSDKEDAESVTTKFYYLLRDKKYQDTYKLFSPRFLEITNESKIKDIYDASDNKLGSIKDQNLISWKTNIVEGSNPKSEYLLVYEVKREKFISKETIRLEKENDTIKILAYNVQSDGFLDTGIK